MASPDGPGCELPVDTYYTPPPQEAAFSLLPSGSVSLLPKR
jgi:hypothetical protein